MALTSIESHIVKLYTEGKMSIVDILKLTSMEKLVEKLREVKDKLENA